MISANLNKHNVDRPCQFAKFSNAAFMCSLLFIIFKKSRAKKKQLAAAAVLFI